MANPVDTPDRPIPAYTLAPSGGVPAPDWGSAVSAEADRPTAVDPTVEAEANEALIASLVGVDVQKYGLDNKQPPEVNDAADNTPPPEIYLNPGLIPLKDRSLSDASVSQETPVAVVAVKVPKVEKAAPKAPKAK